MDARRFFAGKAEAYRLSAAHGDAASLARMVAWLSPRPGARALDVATGGGHAARALAEAGARVVATDATRDMLAALDVGAPVEADAHALPFRTATFGFVACRIAAHHFRDLGSFLREISRVLAPGGRFYALDLSAPESDALERLRDPSHVSSRPPSAWRAACEAAGLRVERLEPRTDVIDLEGWIRRGALPPAREAELRRALAGADPARLGGWGPVEGGLALPRVEVLAVRTPSYIHG